MSTTRPWAKPGSAAAVAAVIALASALPVQAAPSTVVYDALGDSYAVGTGAPAGYPTLINGRMKIALDDNVAEPGATLTSVADQFGALGADTKLVTPSIGGNDVDWASIVVLCALNPDQACAGAAAVTGQAISQAQWALPPVYQAVRRAAPNAHVVVTGYPRLFSPEIGDFTGVVAFMGKLVPFTLTVAEQTMLNDLADQLNAVITDKATKARFQFVDVTKRFDGHGVNSDDPWITGVQSPVPLHPNASGQKAYAAAVTSSVNPGSLR